MKNLHHEGGEPQFLFLRTVSEVVSVCILGFCVSLVLNKIKKNRVFFIYFILFFKFF